MSPVEGVEAVRVEQTPEFGNINIPLKVLATADCLVTTATAYAERGTGDQRDDFIASMRAMLQIIGVAMQDLGA